MFLAKSNLMNHLVALLIILLPCCSSEKKEDIIRREIKLKEIRRGNDVVKLTINSEENVDDTSEIHYQADVRTKSKDSTIADSIFLIKGADGVLLPFSTKNP